MTALSQVIWDGMVGNSTCPFIKVSVDCPSNHNDGFLPTLDLKWPFERGYTKNRRKKAFCSNAHNLGPKWDFWTFSILVDGFVTFSVLRTIVSSKFLNFSTIVDCLVIVSEILPWHVANQMYLLNASIINRCTFPVLGHHPHLVVHFNAQIKIKKNR